jgi:hypothetical protein
MRISKNLVKYVTIKVNKLHRQRKIISIGSEIYSKIKINGVINKEYKILLNVIKFKKNVKS